MILLAALVGLALLDSLNPATVATQAYLLATSRPLARAGAFLAATFVTYVAGGWFLLTGWTRLVGRIAAHVSAWGVAAAEIALGLAVAGFALWSWRRASAGTPFTPRDLGLPACFALGVVSTIEDLPTALPYLAAIDRIAASPADTGGRLLLIGLYCTVYVAPLIVLMAIKAGHPDGVALFDRVRRSVDWAFAKLVPPLSALAACALIADGARRLARALA